MPNVSKYGDIWPTNLHEVLCAGPAKRIDNVTTGTKGSCLRPQRETPYSRKRLSRASVISFSADRKVRYARTFCRHAAKRTGRLSAVASVLGFLPEKQPHGLDAGRQRGGCSGRASPQRRASGLFGGVDGGHRSRPVRRHLPAPGAGAAARFRKRDQRGTGDALWLPDSRAVGERDQGFRLQARRTCHPNPPAQDSHRTLAQPPDPGTPTNVVFEPVHSDCAENTYTQCSRFLIT
ncbi:uncharacterized protein LOC119461756 [Dermacentor silvarum]|uniref:uncharacterized protein LOC119461756 n=1 Tax=Dermacentor silvarum TaxID=543639 RepID=UPI0021018FCE|nr:uncharacterized protein LOC119461756 [Dermacentor silvarum]